ncbi:MAG TPA: hypothetical protein VGY55_00725 [Pirellulales bacterium]|jgi:hypothetical protein|nr:hypothetical protein [Pirellulales bacterium]
MRLNRVFRFVDDDLNQALITLIRKARIEHTVDTGGAVRYSPGDQDVVENKLICKIRDKVFGSWQILTCPKEWIETYKRYMEVHGIPFEEELADGKSWFLIPRKYRPHSWKLVQEESVPTRPRSLAS